MQDRTITDIGELEFKNNSNLKRYELFIQDPYPGEVCTMLIVEFILKDSKINYKGINFDNVNKDNYSLYAYRKGSSRGGDITFTTKCGDFEKKFNTLINSQFKNILAVAEKENKEEYKIFLEWKKAFKEKKDSIKKELQEVYDGLDKKTREHSAYTLSIDVKGKRKLLSEFKSIQKLIVKNGTEGNYFKHGVTSKGENAKCSVCRKIKTEVFGFGSPFKYSTVDKPGMVSGFFNQKNNWINYPICESCALEMELGKNYITKYLTRNFFGKKYYLIPKTVLPKDDENLEDALSIVKEIDYRINNSDYIASSEDFLLEELGKISKNIFTLTFLFFQENPTTKAIKIKLLLEEIPPSRFRKLFIEVPKVINDNLLFKDIDYHFKKKQKQNLRFSFRLIKLFFEDNFYEMIYKIFRGEKINENELYKKFMKVIIANYNKKINNKGFVEKGELLMAKAYMVKSYFRELDLINYNN